MADHITPERVVAIATAAAIPIDVSTALRIAKGVSSAAARFRAGTIDLPFESEPSTYVVVAHKEIKR